MMRSLWKYLSTSPIFVLSLFVGCLSFGTSSGFLSNCQREPEGVNEPKAPGDGGFHIGLSGNPDNYIPGEVYIVSVKGQRSHFRSQKFTRFMLSVESAQQTSLYSIQSVGMFQLYGDVQTLHSETCPNAIIEASNTQKNEIQVRWTAPPSGSGCLKFKATVMESTGQWFMDDGQLTKEICEDIQQSEDVKSQIFTDCCACDEAKYEVTFEGLWSRQTHPKHYPANEWLTHFSDIIGASHSGDYKMWAPGELASDGLKQVAEWGSTRTLESELKRQSDHIRTIIKARGLWYPNVNGKTFAVFRVDNRHHLMSLASMLGPSPDWVVGVSSLELCTKNCSWVDQKVMNMYPWDAGTDSGVTYMAANSPTIPRERIHRITNAAPSDPQSPFFDPNGLPMKPLARLTITRQRIYEKSCSDTGYPYVDDLDYSQEDNEADRPECVTTEWSEFTPCSMTCGKGLRHRSREYMIPLKADMFRCNVQLVEKEMCAGHVPICEGGDTTSIFGNDRFQISTDPVCKVTPWSRWSPCSVTCGEGTMFRTRRYENRMGRKKCNEKLTERKNCMAGAPVCDQIEERQVDPQCSTTQWSSWSVCTATCGEGIRVRTRYFLVPSATEESCNLKTTEKMICKGERESCLIDQTEARQICLEPKLDGPCRGYFARWYYDSSKRICMQFIYGGCRGNRNNFVSYDECTKVCEYSRDEIHSPINETNPNNSHFSGVFGLEDPGARIGARPSFRDHSETGRGRLIAENQLGPKVDCKVSQWSPWSEWSHGWKESTRYVQVEPQNDGKRCPNKMVRRRKCKSKECQVKSTKLQSMSFVFDPFEEYTSPILPSAGQFSAPALSENDKYSRIGVEDSFYLPGDEDRQDIDCEMGDWGPWSACTHSCGRESLQQRMRTVVVKARGTGKPCGPSLERRFCSLPPCHPRPHH